MEGDNINSVVVIRNRYVAALLMCVLLFFSSGSVSSGPGQEPGRPGINENPANDRILLFNYDLDISVESVIVLPYQVVPGVPADEHYPGQEMKIQTLIKNRGTKTVATPVDVLMVIIDDVSEKNIIYSHQMNQTINFMAPNNVTTLTWTWTPPDKPPKGAGWDYKLDGKHTFKLRAITLLESDQNSSNNFNTLTIDIFDPFFGLEITNKLWTQNGLIEFPRRQLASVGGLLYLNFTVNETLNLEPDYAKIAVTDLPEDWYAIPGSNPPFIEVKKTFGRAVSLWVQVSRDNYKALHNVDYYINVTAYSLYSPTVQDTFSFIVNIRFNPGAEFIMPRDITKEPGLHKIGVQLQNTGNGIDYFFVNASVFPEDLNEKWHAEVYSGWRTKILDPAETAEIVLNINVPEKRMDSYKHVIVKASSFKQPGYDTGDDYRLKVFVGEYQRVRLKIADETKLPFEMSPSDEFSFSVNVLNAGNKFNSAVSVKVVDQPENWIISIDEASLEKGLGIGYDADVGVRVITPEKVNAGDYGIQLAGCAGFEETVYDVLDVSIKIKEVDSIIIRSNPPSLTANIGEVVNYLIYIENAGNWPDIYDVSFNYRTPGLEDRGELSQNTVILDAGESAEIVLTLAIPLWADADTNPSTPSIFDGYIIDITAVSWNKPGLSNSVAVETKVKQYYDFNVEADSKIKMLTIGSADPVNFLLTLENRGNIKDTYEIELEGRSSWGRLFVKYRTIAPGDIGNFKFGVTVPPDTGVGVYDFILTITSLGDQSLVRDLTLKVFVSKLELSLTNILINGKESRPGSAVEVQLGTTVLISAEIENTGTMVFDESKFGNCEAVFFDGKSIIDKKNIRYLPSHKNDTITVEWKPKVARAAVTIFVNIDPDGEIGFSNRVNLSRTASVSIVDRDLEQQDLDKNTGFEKLIIPVILIIFLSIVQIFSVLGIRRVKSARIRAGYTQSGEYRPYADIFASGEIEDGTKAPVISTLRRHELPPVTVITRVTEPIVITQPIPFTAPVKRLKASRRI